MPVDGLPVVATLPLPHTHVKHSLVSTHSFAKKEQEDGCRGGCTAAVHLDHSHHFTIINVGIIIRGV
jgi:hypothetical protein